MTERSEIVGVRLTPKERERFEEFVQDNEKVNGLSQLFRIAAYQYIDTDEQEASIDPEEIITAVDSAITPIEERLDKVEEHVLSIDSNVTNDDKIDRLARDIYSVLPEHATESELPGLNDGDQLEVESDLAAVQAISIPETWADYFEENLDDVRRACARMLEYYPDVKFVEDSFDTSDADIQLHQNLGVNQPSPASDVGDESESTVRRYYKQPQN